MSFSMVTRYAHSPKDIEHYSTEDLRNEFLMEKIFNPGDILLTYTYNDRMIFGGVTPTTEPLEIKLDKQLGVDYFLQRRELGFINIGGSGSVTIDGQKDDIVAHDAITLVRVQNPSNLPLMILKNQRSSTWSQPRPTKLILTRNCRLPML